MPLANRVGYELKGSLSFLKNEDGAVLFFILCMKTAVLSMFSFYTLSISQDSKRPLEWSNMFLYVSVLKYVFVGCLSLSLSILN